MVESRSTSRACAVCPPRELNDAADEDDYQASWMDNHRKSFSHRSGSGRTESKRWIGYAAAREADQMLGTKDVLLRTRRRKLQKSIDATVDATEQFISSSLASIGSVSRYPPRFGRA